MKQELLFNHENKVFTSLNPKNSFIIDYSNGYSVKLTTNVTAKTPWKEILKGNYKKAIEDGTPEYLLVNGIKYTYIDYKYATQYLNYHFVHDNKSNINNI